MNFSEDRFLGCLVGLAVGDAVGTTLEFETPGTFEPIDDMIGGGPFQLEPGEWTDDTSMALCLGTSLIEKGFDLIDQLNRYCQWESEGYLCSNGRCFDIGNTVAAALQTFRLTGRATAGSTDSLSAGNGSLMRLAPIPMFYASDANAAVKYSGESSRTTHGALTCIDACRYFGGLLFSVLNGVTKEELLSPSFFPIPGDDFTPSLCPEIAEIRAGSFQSKHPPEIRGTGYVVKSLEAALWAFFHSSNFRSGCLLAVNLGDDADTTGAIYGQLAGAFYGHQNIPERWREQIAHRLLIENLAKGFHSAAKVRVQADNS